LLARRRFSHRAPLGFLACLLSGRECGKQLVVGPQQLTGRDVGRDEAPPLRPQPHADRLQRQVVLIVRRDRSRHAVLQPPQLDDDWVKQLLVLILDIQRLTTGPSGCRIGPILY